MLKQIFCTLAGLIVLSISQTVMAADWPMWRNNTARSGATSEPLPDELSLKWSRQLPAPQIAWPNESRLHFDASYEPIVLGKQMFVGSPNDGSVTAYDTESGSQNWKFYTEGPVRLAPVAWNGKVIFGSDDGNLYCVAAMDGKLLWKVSGAPAERADYRHLGNNRLVSYWPVRGAPVLSEGVVYFGAGIWPTMGVFVHAVNAETGKLIWTNGDSHALQNVRIDHNYLNESGISPQGYMLVVGEKLVVPNGRSMPARFDKKTGKLLYFVQGYRNGDSRVVANEELLLVGETGVVNLADGREIGNRWVAAGKEAPKAWDFGKVDKFEGPLFPYKMFPACTFRSVLDAGTAYGMHQSTLYAYDVNNGTVSLYDKKFSNRDIKPARWDIPTQWKFDTKISPAKTTTRTMIKAGNRFYSHVDNTLVAINVPTEKTGSPKLAWKKSLKSRPSSLVAADEKLFVVTEDGTIHCYGKKTEQVLTYEFASQELPNRNDRWTTEATEILQTTGATEGYALVLGLSNGRLVEELLRHSKLNVIAVDANVQKVNALRDKLAAHETYSSRLQAVVGNPFHFPFPPYLANLIVSENLSTADFGSAKTISNLFNALRPYGGLACLSLSDKQQAAFAKSIIEAKIEKAESQQAGRFTTLKRVGSLPGSSNWTHETGDAARSFFSKDERVKAPLGVLWYGDGRDHGFYKRKDYGHGVKPQVAGGRLFALQIASRTLHSVDVYTGRLLWTRKVGGSMRYASMENEVYLADERKCLVLNAATGEPVATYTVDVGKEETVPVSVTDIRVTDDIILFAVRFNKENAISKGRWNSSMLVALDRKTGKQLWKRPANQRYNTAAIAIGGGLVYCMDSHSPIEIDQMKRRGMSIENLEVLTLALNTKTGKTVWEKVTTDPPAAFGSLHFMGLRSRDDWLAYSADNGLLITGKNAKTRAYNAKTGDEIWQKDLTGNQPLILTEKTFINQSGKTFDIKTGTLIDSKQLFKRGGCNYAVGNKNLIFLRDNCAAYVDINDQKQYDIRNLRTGCSNSLVAADGLLNVPCFSAGCVCNYPIQTSFSMLHMAEVKKWAGTPKTQSEKPEPKEK